MPNENGTARLDRIERALELLIDDHVQFQQEHKQLLTAQIVLTDRVDRFIKESAERQKRIDEQMAELREAQTALIQIVDDLILKRPPLA